MAIFNRYSDYTTGGFDKRDPRDELIRQPADEAEDKIKATAIGALTLLGALPRAFARSQERELKRLLMSGKDENDPRVVALKTALERAAVLQETATLGMTRIERFIAPTDRAVISFSGFVSDAELRPLSGFRVQVSEPQAETLSAVTDAKGYFSIVIGKNTSFNLRREAGLVAAMLGAKADPKNAGVRAEAAAAAAAAAAATAAAEAAGATAVPLARLAKVEIFDPTGKPVHEDPHPLPLDQGNKYREYLLAAAPPPGRRDIVETGPVRDVRANLREAAGTPAKPGTVAAPSAGTGASPATPVDSTDAAAPGSTAAKLSRAAAKAARAAGKPAVDESAATPSADASTDTKPGAARTRASSPRVTGAKTGGDKDKP